MANRIGAPLTILIDGIAVILGAGVFAFYLPRIREQSRPIYIQRGIIPEVAEGLRAATEGTDMPKK